MNVNDQFARSGVLVLVGIPIAIELTSDDMSRCRSAVRDNMHIPCVLLRSILYLLILKHSVTHLAGTG